MSLLEDLSTELANSALDKMEELGDESVLEAIANEIGSSSPTLEENYRTAVRLIRAARRARAAIATAKKTEHGATPREETKPAPEPVAAATPAAKEEDIIVDVGEAVLDEKEILQIAHEKG